MPSKRRPAFALPIALIALAAPALAHHGIGRFDPTREIDVEGTLTTLDFVNPHAYVHFNAVDANGEPFAMQCILPGGSMFDVPALAQQRPNSVSPVTPEEVASVRRPTLPAPASRPVP